MVVIIKLAGLWELMQSIVVLQVRAWKPEWDCICILLLFIPNSLFYLNILFPLSLSLSLLLDSFFAGQAELMMKAS